MYIILVRVPGRKNPPDRSDNDIVYVSLVGRVGYVVRTYQSCRASYAGPGPGRDLAL